VLFQLYGDPVTEAAFSIDATIQSWLDVEAALGHALADGGIASREQAESIAAACVPGAIDTGRLWRETRIVGYPILPLVRMICEALPPETAGLVHWGATTQDIMDTGLVLQVSAVVRRLCELAAGFGDGLAMLTDTHRGTVMAGRTHGQQAVPTTFGAKCAVFLAQVGRDLLRLDRAGRAARQVSLFGAGGTSAALGDAAPVVRRALAARLGLADTAVPWHVARDNLVEVAQAAAVAAGTAVRFAREIIDLARTEVGELAEADGEYRGASSTMPQKANPVSAEAIIGFGVSGGTMVGALLRGLEAGHERAAGEWQVEWQALPYVLRSSAGALGIASQLPRELRVFPQRMRANLELDHGLVLAEAYMSRLARVIGRDKAHELVYQASRQSREQDRSLAEILSDAVGDESLRALAAPIGPEEYIGATASVCDESLSAWRDCRTAVLSEPEPRGDSER
jgi:3-carboxy-cis,cis-muconate cycloisomerase